MAGERRNAPKEAVRPRFRDSLRELAGAQKSGKGSPAYSRFVNRRFGRVLAAAAHVAGLTPNAVTAISAVFTFSGIIILVFLPPTWPTGVVVGLLLVVGYAMDAADGQLARVRGGGSLAGEWLDHIVDSLKSTSIHLAVLLNWYRFTDLDDAWLLVPIGFAVVSASAFFAQILNEQLRRNEPTFETPVPVADQPRPSVVVSLLKVPTDYGLLCLSFLLLGSGQVFVAVYAAMFVLSAAYLALALPKWFRDMRALDAGARSSA